MNILLLGATGFIGRHIAHTLHAQGHHIVTPQLPHGQRFNMAQMTTPAAWLPHLRVQGLDTQTVDAVINAVGVLRERAGQPMRVVHTLAPMALFTACADMGVRRVIQLSALGIDDIATPYAQTKREADAALLALVEQGCLDAVVLRPSIVMGHGGASTALFQTLARLPMLLWPQRATVCQVQPLSVQDLAWGCARLLDNKLLINQSLVTGIVAAVGDERASVAQWVARIRTQMGHRDALICTLPNALAAASARLGDAVPLTPWGRNTWALLSKNNIAEAQAWTAILGRNPSPALSFMAEDAMKYKAATPTEV
jgi:nucleoside-diphosphate-sugar epimerase